MMPLAVVRGSRLPCLSRRPDSCRAAAGEQREKTVPTDVVSSEGAADSYGLPRRSFTVEGGRRMGQHSGILHRVGIGAALALAAIYVLMLLAPFAVPAVGSLFVDRGIDHGVSCGIVSVAQDRLLTSEAEVEVDLACFADAYARCASAHLVSIGYGVDAGVRQTFVTGPGLSHGGQCGIVDISQGLSPGPWPQFLTQDSCAGLVPPRLLPVVGLTLTLQGCGSEGDEVVPMLYVPLSGTSS